ncbi:MAG: hypothetical protein CFE21_14975 [Bacteroidetes bacterium B1(2017)]|nr:MAG: hypothetical protein CFE21_14975 [Bacteroidetes bacterium B1(2017)]
MENNPTYFEEKLIVLEKRILVVFKKNYVRNLERARDKQIVKKEQLFNYFCEFRTRFFFEKPIVKLIASFDYYYLRGLPIDLLMCDIERDYYRQKENEEDAFPKEYSDPYIVLFLCAKYAAYYQFIKGFQKDFPNEVEIFFNEMEIEKRNMLGYDEADIIKVNVKGELEGFGEKTSDKMPESIVEEIDFLDCIEATNIRQTLALTFLLDELKIQRNDNTKKSKLIGMLTGKSSESIRKLLSNLYGKKPQTLAKDLEFILPYFQDLGIKTIENKIEMVLRKLNNKIENQRIKDM